MEFSAANAAPIILTPESRAERFSRQQRELKIKSRLFDTYAACLPLALQGCAAPRRKLLASARQLSLTFGY